MSRTGGNWIALFLLNVAVNWAVPFLVLLPRASKRNPAVLKWVAIVMLAGRWLDLYLTVMPQVMAAPRVGTADVLIAAGYAGVFFLAGGAGPGACAAGPAERPVPSREPRPSPVRI